MPGALFCFHKYGKWSKPRDGRKSRRCSKCRHEQKRQAGALDQLFCWHKWHRTRNNPVLRCVKCGKPKAAKGRK